MIVRLGVVGVLVEVGGIRKSAGSLQLDQLGGERLVRVSFAEVVGVPHDVGMAVNDQSRSLLGGERVALKDNLLSRERQKP